MAQFAGVAPSAEPSPLFTHRARLSPLNCKNAYLVLAQGEESAVQAVDGYIVWLYCLGVSHVQNAKDLAHERPRLCAS